jgi:hypothetical protein
MRQTIATLRRDIDFASLIIDDNEDDDVVANTVSVDKALMALGKLPIADDSTFKILPTGGGGEGDDACLFSTYSEDDDVVDEIEGFLDDISSLLSTFEI